MIEQYQDFIRDVVITLHMNIKETGERKGFAEPEELSHIEARLQAYHEVLSILRDSATEFRIPKEELGL
ncbi:MAG TPA: hypothetical protein VFE50_23830 [Cyclobacteriaceae bacterium]|nr:hypothetical protein [Cyclobacteriaceae bacterium]